jgi:hypothetical protein
MLSIRNKKQRSKNTKWIVISASALIAIVAAAAYIFVAKPFDKKLDTTGETRPANSVDYGPPTDAQKQAGDAKKDEIIKQAEDGGANQNKGKLEVTISRVGQANMGGSTAGQAVNVRVLVTGASSGECTFTFSKDGQSDVARTAPIAYQATTATCGVDIPASDFGVSGNWKMVVKAVNGTSEGSAEQAVEVAK